METIALAFGRRYSLTIGGAQSGGLTGEIRSFSLIRHRINVGRTSTFYFLDPFSVFSNASHTHSVPLLCLARSLLPSSGLEGLFEHCMDVNVIVKRYCVKRINKGRKNSVPTS